MIRSWDWRTGAAETGRAPQSDCVQHRLHSGSSQADRSRLFHPGSRRLAERETARARSGPRRHVQWGVAIPAGDRRAIVGGFSGRLTGFDLEKMVMPTTASVDEMTRLAELAAGRRIMSQGSIVPISGTEWTERWEQLRPPRMPPRGRRPPRRRRIGPVRDGQKTKKTSARHALFAGRLTLSNQAILSGRERRTTESVGS